MAEILGAATRFVEPQQGRLLSKVIAALNGKGRSPLELAAGLVTASALPTVLALMEAGAQPSLYQDLSQNYLPSS